MTALLAGVGVAAIQALLPGVMKQRFHARVPFAMGLFSASIMGGGGLGARLSPWVAAMGSIGTPRSRSGPCLRRSPACGRADRAAHGRTESCCHACRVGAAVPP